MIQEINPISLLKSYKKPILIIIFIIICSFLFFSFFGKNYVIGIIDNMVKQQLLSIEQSYNNNIQIRDEQIQELQKQLSASEKTYNDLRRRIGNVEKRIEDRKPPVTTIELKDRLNQLGYSPTN